MDRNPPANAGDVGSIPGLGHFHMPQSNEKPVHLNYRACVLLLLKPMHLEPVLPNRRSHRDEKPEPCSKE